MADDDIAYLVPWAEIETHERRLPHWHQGRVAVFVTWRLADALPQAQLAAWQAERAAWLARRPQPWDDATRRAYRERFAAIIDRWLDAGHGSCLLSNPAAREELARVLHAFDGTRYRLHAWVAMPNHVHVLFSPSGTEPAGKTIGAWKGVSARRIRQRLGLRSEDSTERGHSDPPTGRQECLPSGSFSGAQALLPAGLSSGAQALLPAHRQTHGHLWQAESWDTLIRSPAHFAACRQYIVDNPARARLAPAACTLWLEESRH